MEADVTDPKDRPEDDREREDQELDEALDVLNMARRG